MTVSTYVCRLMLIRLDGFSLIGSENSYRSLTESLLSKRRNCGKVELPLSATLVDAPALLAHHRVKV